METINNIELKDENIYPDDTVLRAVLDDSFPVYKKLLELFGKNGMNHEWRYYHDGKAWLCKVQKKKKTVVWMSAWKGFMKASIYIPEKYMDAVVELDINESVKEKFRSTKNVGKSKPCIFELRDETVLNDLEKVMIYKTGCK